MIIRIPNKVRMAEEKNKKKFSVQGIGLTALGWEIALPIFGGVILGHYLDRLLNTTYQFTLSLLGLGIFIGYYNIYKPYRSPDHGKRSRDRGRGHPDRGTCGRYATRCCRFPLRGSGLRVPSTRAAQTGCSGAPLRHIMQRADSGRTAGGLGRDVSGTNSQRRTRTRCIPLRGSHGLSRAAGWPRAEVVRELEEAH